ncbi:YihY/virulence factor BrkB family protein [Nannocystis punicea]|uniref:YihY/virulence factor BrkB family protein n=1 Tax=Nannocystis punicea TaxID=2995304 RepID=A0ABY7H5A1_9BACT|nr:YihY/virulence factor BrkB family protein [Nannocystis poenicansa]WAS94452.1 YihY/virulence factor BrkB family protein [Nannocystis poenicansa]
MRTLREIYQMLKDAALEFSREDPFTQAGALSYYTMFSLAPFLLLLVAIVGLIYGEEAARGEVVDRLQHLIGEQAAGLAQDILAHAHKAGGGWLSAIVSGVVMLFGATTAFGQLQAALDHIWGAAPSKAGWRNTVRGRLLGLVLILALGAAVVALLVAGSIVSGLSALSGAADFGWFWRLVDLGVSLSVMTGLFALLFKLLPNAEVRWREVVVGAATTSLLFTIGQWGIGVYIGRAAVGSAYGAAGSVVVLMAWVYYSSLILLFGAEVTQTHARRSGRAIVSCARQEGAEVPAGAVTSSR